MARLSLSYKPRLEKSTSVNKGQSLRSQAQAAAYMYQGLAKSDVSQLTQAQKAWAARLNAQARAPLKVQAQGQALPTNMQELAAALRPQFLPRQGPNAPLPNNMYEVAQAMRKNMPEPIAAKPYMGISEADINKFKYWYDHWFNFDTPADLLNLNPKPKPDMDQGFNKYAPPTNTVLPDTYQGQVNRLVERAAASGRTLPDTIQGMLDRLGQQYAITPPRPPMHEGLENRMLPDTEEGAIYRMIEQLNPLPSGPSDGGGGGGGGGYYDPYGGGGGTAPSLADIFRWLYGKIFWRGF